MLVLVYTCQNTSLLEITCRGSNGEMDGLINGICQTLSSAILLVCQMLVSGSIYSIFTEVKLSKYM